MSESGQNSQSTDWSKRPGSEDRSKRSRERFTNQCCKWTIFPFSTTFEVLLEVYHVTNKVEQPYGFACSLKSYWSVVFDWDWERIYPRLNSPRNYIWEILAYWFNSMLLFKFYIIAHNLSMNNYVYCSNTLHYIHAVVR